MTHHSVEEIEQVRVLQKQKLSTYKIALTVQKSEAQSNVSNIII